MIHRGETRGSIPLRKILLLLAAGIGMGCRESTAPNQTATVQHPVPPGWELSPLQQRVLASPVAPEAAGRPATRADLEEARGWFGPGEMEAVLAIVNRSARAKGADTLAHCLPLCDPAAATGEPRAH